MSFQIHHNYSLADFNRICEQIAKMGTRGHEHLKLVRNRDTNDWELQATNKPRGCSRIWSWFYKPAECRFANVSAFAIALFNQHQKEFAQSNPSALRALMRLKAQWANKSCAEALNKFYSMTALNEIMALKNKAETHLFSAQETNGLAQSILRFAERAADWSRIDANRLAEIKLLEEGMNRTYSEAQAIAITFRADSDAQATIDTANREAEATLQQSARAAQELKVQAETRAREKERESKRYAEELAVLTEHVRTDVMKYHSRPSPEKAQAPDRALLDDRETMDCAIECRGNEYVKAHWIKLKQIPYFQTDLSKFKQADRKEKDSERHFDGVFVDYSLETVSALIQFLYLNQVQSKSMNKWLEMYRIADFVHYDKFKAYCVTNISEGLKRNPTALFEVLPVIPPNHPVTPCLLERFIESSIYRKWPDVPTSKQRMLFEKLTKMQAVPKPEPSTTTALGSCFEHGIGVELDQKQSKALYEEAAKQYYAPAQERLALFHDDEAQRLRLAHTAASQKWAPAHYMIGHSYEKRVPSEREKAIYHFKIAAEAGYPPAIYEVVVEEYGRLPTSQYPARLLKMLKSAATQGYGRALCSLGIDYVQGKAVSRDEYLGFKYLAAGVEQQDVQAMLGLANCYKHGWGTAQNLERALQLYKMAAEYNEKSPDGTVYTILGMQHENQNRELAIEYFTKAAIMKNESAIAHLQRLGVWDRVSQQHNIRLV